MSTGKKLAVAALALLVAFAFGRWSAPEKVKIETKVVEIEKKSEESKSVAERNKRKETTVREIVRPDGTRETITTTVETSETSKETGKRNSSETASSEETAKEVTYGGSRLNLSVLAGSSFSAQPPVWGGHASKQFIGPISLGIWGLSTGTAGVSLGLSF